MSRLETIFEDIECTFLENGKQTLDEDLNNICLIEDTCEQSIKLKIFLKENIEYVTTNNLFQILSNKIKNNSETWYILINFYNLIKQKFSIILNLKTWKQIFINKIFWDLPISEQINFLIQMKNYFLSIYDCSLGGQIYHLKLIKIFESANYNYNQIMDDIEDRLKRILTLVGPKIFENLEIPLITIKQLYEFSIDEIFNYFNIIFKKIKELLEKTINQFEEFNLVCEKLDFILSV